MNSRGIRNPPPEFAISQGEDRLAMGIVAVSALEVNMSDTVDDSSRNGWRTRFLGLGVNSSATIGDRNMISGNETTALNQI